MIGLAFILFAAALATGLARWLRLPLIPLYLVAGMALEPLFSKALSFLQEVIAAVGVDLVRDSGEAALGVEIAILELGLAFLVFAVGLELSPRRAGNRKKAVLMVGLSQFLVLGAAGFSLTLYLGEDLPVAGFLGLAVAASSTLVVIRHLKLRQRMFEPGGRLVTGVLVLQDLLVIVGLVLLLRLDDGVVAMAAGLGGLVVLAMLGYLAARFVMPWLVLRAKLGEELLLLSVLANLSVFMSLSYWMDLPLVAGAFMAGLSLSTFPVNGVVRGLINSLNDFFTALFFLVLGAMVSLPPVEMWMGGALLLLLVLVITPPLVKLIAELNGLSSRSSLESGLLLSQTSEFSLILALYAMMQGKISPDLFSLLAVITVISMAWTPFIASRPVVEILVRLSPFSRWWALRAGRRDVRDTNKGLVIMAGMGDAGERLAKAILRSNREVIVMEEDAVLLHRLKEEDIPFMRGDPANPRHLREAGLENAVAVISTSTREEDNRALLLAMGKRKIPVIVPTFDRQGAEKFEVYRQLYPVTITDRTVEQFLQWFDEVAELKKS